MYYLSIIIVNYNTKDFLGRCLESIINNSGDANCEIIVVDTETGVTLKKGYKEKNRLRLEAANKSYPTIYSENPRIIGCCLPINTRNT